MAKQLLKPDFSRRLEADEMMDDFSIVDHRLEAALEDLRIVNRWTGGHLASLLALRDIVKRSSAQSISVLDVGAGIGDYAEVFARWGARVGVEVRVVALDANPATVNYARETLARRLEPPLGAHVSAEVGDVFDLSYPDRSFDIVHAGLFLHHFSDAECVRILDEMSRVGRHVVINDLHRHPIAYHAVRLMAALFPVSEMFTHDGPISVLRAFDRADLERICEVAGIDAAIRWFPGFRWIMTGQAP
jgi:2-polyprenyl-3-methyl-5-hydroxy-6-metoxy-1,4-benzoquinol methylase